MLIGLLIALIKITLYLTGIFLLYTFRLYRHHTVKDGNVYIKDLSRIGRELSKIIIIDNMADNFK